MNILLFGTDSEKINAAAISLRSEGHRVNHRNPVAFNPLEIEVVDVVILLEPAEVVKDSYAAYNTRQGHGKQVQVEERFDFNPPSDRELHEMAGKPYWPDMSVKELIEYAQEHFDKKVIGRTKNEIIAAVDQLWSADRESKRPTADQSEGSIPVGDQT